MLINASGFSFSIPLNRSCHDVTRVPSATPEGVNIIINIALNASDSKYNTDEKNNYHHVRDNDICNNCIDRRGQVLEEKRYGKPFC